MGFAKSKRPLAADSFQGSGKDITANTIPLASLVRGTNGQLPIGQTSAATAYKSVTGDVTIDQNGVTSIGAGKVTGAKLPTGVGYFSVYTKTNGTTPVNVFGAGGAPCALTMVGALVVALDTTAGNISLKQAANTVFTAAKGTTTGLSTDSGAISNATYAAADACTVVSSSAGNAGVILFFTVA